MGVDEENLLVFSMPGRTSNSEFTYLKPYLAEDGVRAGSRDLYCCSL